MVDVHIVGAGPGDPELITRKGYRLVQEADVVIYAGSLLNPAILAHGFRFGHLADGGPRVPDGEEEFGVDCQASRLAAPIHVCSPCVTVCCRDVV